MIFRKDTPFCTDAQMLLEELNQTLISIIGNNGTIHVDYNEFEREGAFFLLGYEDDVPMCCAGLRVVNDSTAEIKRVFARKNRIGAGAQLMAQLEQFAQESGYSRLILECRSGNPHAISFYKRVGYAVCDNYPPYVGVENAVCMEKYI